MRSIFWTGCGLGSGQKDYWNEKILVSMLVTHFHLFLAIFVYFYCGIHDEHDDL